jgi:hypothetical protein
MEYSSGFQISSEEWFGEFHLAGRRSLKRRRGLKN